VGFGIIRVQFERSLVLGLGLRQMAGLLQQCDTQIVVGQPTRGIADERGAVERLSPQRRCSIQKALCSSG
jgi:hypothetical protein